MAARSAAKSARSKGPRQHIASASMAQAGCGYVRNYTCPAHLIHLKVAVSGFFWGGAMSIDPCLEQGVFEPEATTAMGEAFEAACEELHDGGRLPMVREVVALRIIAAARSGELNAVRLRTAALNWIIVTQMLSAVSR